MEIVICKVILSHLGSIILLTDPEIHCASVHNTKDSAAAIGLSNFKKLHVCEELCIGIGIQNIEIETEEDDLINY